MAFDFDPSLIEARCLVCGVLRFLDELLEVHSLVDRAPRRRYVCRLALVRPGDPRCFDAIGPASSTAIAAAVPVARARLSTAGGGEA